MVNDFVKLSDAELLTRYTAGDEAAFREIVNRYKNSLYAFLRQFLNRHDLVEDVFQETFLQLFASRDSFDTNRPLRPWLFTIAANKAKDALRRGEEAGLTHCTMNAQRGSFVLYNCCGCCCAPLRVITKLKIPTTMAKSNFVAELSETNVRVVRVRGSLSVLYPA